MHKIQVSFELWKFLCYEQLSNTYFYAVNYLGWQPTSIYRTSITQYLEILPIFVKTCDNYCDAIKWITQQLISNTQKQFSGELIV